MSHLKGGNLALIPIVNQYENDNHQLGKVYASHGRDEFYWWYFDSHSLPFLCLIHSNCSTRPHEQYLLLLEEQPRRSFAPEPLEAIGLTKREAEVLFWSAQDKTTKEIAATLKCSSKTVEKHFEHLYAKLGVQTRTAALAKALERLGIAALRLLH
jgi:DNA-binding CsgD family transcriptional regulator